MFNGKLVASAAAILGIFLSSLAVPAANALAPSDDAGCSITVSNTGDAEINGQNLVSDAATLFADTTLYCPNDGLRINLTSATYLLPASLAGTPALNYLGPWQLTVQGPYGAASAVIDGGATYASSTYLDYTYPILGTGQQFIKYSYSAGSPYTAANPGVILSNLQVHGTYSTDGGSVLRAIGSTSSGIYSSYFYDNTTSASGIGAAVRTGGALAIDGSRFEYNGAGFDADGGNFVKASDGGAVWILGKSNTYSSILNSTFKQNRSDRYGGAVFVSRSKYEIKRSTFTENWAALGGGAVYSGGTIDDGANYNLSYGTSTLIGCSTFTSNRSLGKGGAVLAQGLYVSSRSGLNVAGCDFGAYFDSNSADVGAAFSGSFIYMGDSVVHNNYTVNGAAIELQNSFAAPGAIVRTNQPSRIINTDFTDNVNSNGTGGAIASRISRIDASAFMSEQLINLSLLGTNFDGNSASSAGAVYAQGTLFVDQHEPGVGDFGITTNSTLDDVTVPSVFNDNTAYWDGGAIKVVNDNWFQIENSTFTYNHLTSTGGAGAVISTNLRSGVVINSTFAHNDSNANAGVVYADAGAQVTFYTSTFTQNSAASGAVSFVNQGVPDGAGYRPSMVEFVGSTIADNDTSSATSGVFASVDAVGTNLTSLKGSIVQQADTSSDGPICGTDYPNNLPEFLSGNTIVEQVPADAPGVIQQSGESFSCGTLSADDKVVTATQLGLGSLADHTGPTQTMGIPATSAAFGYWGNACFGPDEGSVFDQRGYERDILGDPCESGAYEVPRIVVTADDKSIGATGPEPTYTQVTTDTDPELANDTWTGSWNTGLEPVCSAYSSWTSAAVNTLLADTDTEGDYVIACSGGAPSDGRYVGYVNGTLTIGPKVSVDVTATADDLNWNYGDTPGSYTFTADDEGFSFTTDPTCAIYDPEDTGYLSSIALDSWTSAGTYVIHCTGGSWNETDWNLTDIYDGELVIDPETGIEVTPGTGYSYAFGSTAPTLDYSSTGWVNEDGWDTEPTCLAYSTTDTAYESGFTPSSTTAVGSYVVHCSGGDAGSNYGETTYGADGTLTVTKAASTLDYTGTYYVGAASGSVTLQATLGGSCAANSTVKFYYDGDQNGSYETLVASVTTNGSGVASYNWSYPTGISMFDLEARYEGPNCTDSAATATLVIGSSGDSSNGGGWYNLNGKVGLGYTVQVKSTKTGTTTTGQLLWTTKGNARFKGAINSYTKATCPSGFTGTCAVISGTGKLSVWNATTMAWDVTGSTVAFSLKVLDGGSAQVCSGPKNRLVCSTVAKPDYFAMSISTYVLVGETTVLTQMKGGNLVVK